MATRKRVKISHDVKHEISQVRNRSSAKFRGAQRDPAVINENPTARIQEAERFSYEQGQGDFIPLTYDPTKTSWPGNGWDHRRTVAAGYDRKNGIIRIEFYTDGSVYDYGTITPVPPFIAYQFRATQSPGRYINSTLESYGYERIN